MIRVLSAAATKIPAGAVVPFLSAGAMFYNQALTAAVGVFLAAKLGPEPYGAVNLARNIFVAALSLSPLGLDIGLQRYFGEAGDSSGEARVLFRLRARAFGVAVLAALAFALAGWWDTSIFARGGTGMLIAGAMLGLPFATDMAVLGGACRGAGAPFENLLATYLVQPTCRALLLIPLLTRLPGVWAVVLATALSYVLAWVAMVSRAPRPASSWLAPPVPTSRETRRVLNYSIVMGLSAFVFSLARSLDTLALSAWAGFGDVGRYAIAQMIGLMVGLIGASLGQTLGARVAAARDSLEMREILSRNMFAASLLASPLCVAAAIWGADVDLLIGNAYRTPVAVYILVAITQWIIAVAHPSSAGLTMTGRHARELGNNIAALAAQAAGCALLTPRLGMVGAAGATLITMVALNATRQAQIRIAIGRTALTPRLAMPPLIAAMVAAPVLAVQHALGFRAWWLTGLACGVEVCGAFAAMLFVSADARRLLWPGAR